MSTTTHSSCRTRTRVLRTPQTHDGCFTCKARKVRCDLRRPFCDRCTRANKICGGYRYSVICEGASCSTACHSTASRQTAVQTRSLDSHSQTLEAAHLMKLGCEVLHRGAIRQNGLAASFWRSTIPQLGHLDSLVGASMAALGAALNACLVCSPSRAIVYSRHCASALRGIQQAVESSVQSSVALVAACLLLAVSEILMDQELSALSHLQGMLLVLRQRQRSTIDSSPVGSCSNDDVHFILEDDFDVAGAILDISTASYALGLEPRLPTLATNKVQESNTVLNDNIRVIERRALTTLHSSYAFASKHYHWRYVAQKFVPQSAFVNQNYICTELFQRDQEIGALIASLHPTRMSRAHILRAQCSTCLIYCQNLLEPREMGYDYFWRSFNAIVEDAEIVLQDRLSGAYDYFNLSLDLGVIQPLYFTSIKCRELQIRRKAVDLLRMSGREGPFDGKRLAVVAQRAVELETSIVSGIEDEVKGDLSFLVPEKQRLHSAGFESTQYPGMPYMGVPASFSRCQDVGILLEADSPNEYKEPKHWEIWDELLPWPAELKLDIS